MDHIRNFHSLPSVYLFLFFAAGIALAWLWGGRIDLKVLIIIYVLIFSLLFFLYRKNSFFIFSLILFTIAGFIRMWLALYIVSPSENNMFRNHYDAFQGTIIDADRRDSLSSIYILSCEKIFVGDIFLPASGSVVIHQGSSKTEFSYGDVVRIYGKAQFPALPTNPGEFNYRRYLQLNDRFFLLRLDKQSQIIKIFSGNGNLFQSVLFNPVREVVRGILDKYLSGQAPSIVKALILGQRGSLDKDIIRDFQKTGVIHVLAISGLHVGFIALMLQFALSLLRIPQKVAMSITILFLMFFIALVNFKAPVVRASLMMSFYYLSKFTRRPQKPLNVIALAALIILWVKPEQLLLPGFQYSFAAVFGLIYGSEKLNSLFPYFSFNRQKIASFFNKNVRMPFLASLCAIIATLPLTWYYFGSIQIGAVIANIFIIPLIALILFLCIVFIIFSGVSIFPVQGMAVLIDWLIEWMITMVSHFASLPYIQIITGHPGSGQLILVIMAVFLFYNIKYIKAGIGLMAVILMLVLFSLGSFTGYKNLLVTFIHVGQGDATLIKFPNKKVALIDAGQKSFAFDAGQRYVDPVLRYYGISKIDYLIASHPHSDHIGGFEFILKNYAVDTLIINDFSFESELYDQLLLQAAGENVFLKKVQRGDIIYPDRYSRMYILHPADPFIKNQQISGKAVNNSSVVIKLVHGKNSFLLNGDAEVDAEFALLKYNMFLDCDVLKVGHHGSKTSSSNLFLDVALPEQVVISVGEKNKFNHPSPETLLKYAQRHIPVYRTDICGAVIFESDGKHLQRIDWRL